MHDVYILRSQSHPQQTGIIHDNHPSISGHLYLGKTLDQIIKNPAIAARTSALIRNVHATARIACALLPITPPAPGADTVYRYVYFQKNQTPESILAVVDMDNVDM
jgi:O-succinylbenzoate synthase